MSKSKQQDDEIKLSIMVSACMYECAKFYCSKHDKTISDLVCEIEGQLNTLFENLAKHRAKHLRKQSEMLGNASLTY
jgi:hypothetical protein